MYLDNEVEQMGDKWVNHKLLCYEKETIIVNIKNLPHAMTEMEVFS